MERNKHIMSFNNFFLNEEKKDNNNNKKDIEIPKNPYPVVSKKFFNELKKNVLFWFRNSKMGEMFELVDISNNERYLEFWYEEKEKSPVQNPTYIWRCKYLESDNLEDVSKIERVKMSLDLYNWDKTKKLKEMLIDISVKKVKEDFLLKRMKRLRKKIIKDPKNKKEKEKVLDRTYSHLTDEYY